MRQRDRVPRIVVTVAAVVDPDSAVARRKNGLYAEAVARHGGEPLVIDETTNEADRAAAFAAMDGLLLSGGADLAPARYDRPVQGARDVEPGRDELEAAAWDASQAHGVPVLGICRGFQAINVFSGGGLLQHVDGHIGARYGHGAAKTHPLRIAPGTRLARILFPTNPRGGVLDVNTYHHQGVRAPDLGPGLVASAWAASQAGDLVEALEAADGRFVIGVQTHPERTESTPAAFERLFGVFLDAARGPLRRTQAPSRAGPPG
jgi:putative glutamine amidotransferase